MSSLAATRATPLPRGRFRRAPAPRSRTPPRRGAWIAPRAAGVDDDAAPPSGAAASSSSSPRTQHVVCVSFDAVVDAADETCLVGVEAARRFWPRKIPGATSDYADVFRTLVPCLEESSSFESALMVRVMAEENLAARTRFREALRRRKARRLREEAAHEEKMRRAVTAKQRERLELEARERAAALERKRAEYRAENARLRNGMRTRPLNAREVVAGWEEIKVAAAMKFGCDLETSVGWEGLVVTPRGLQATVNDVREAFAAGTIELTKDDTIDDDDDDEEGEDGGGDDDDEEGATRLEASPSSSAAASPKDAWLACHALRPGASAFFEACREGGHRVVVLGGPGRSAAACREVLTHLGVDVEDALAENEAEASDASDDASDASDDASDGSEVSKASDGSASGAVSVAGSETGVARGLAVAALMHASERPRQRWHLVDASLAELRRVRESGLPETAAFSAAHASWVPGASMAARVRAEVEGTTCIRDVGGLFELVGVKAPVSVMDRVGE